MTTTATHIDALADRWRRLLPAALACSHSECDGPAWVYFIESGGAVKIGTTRRLRKRLIRVRMHCPTPIRLIHLVPGDADVESQFHHRFADYRIHGEWFAIRGELNDYIRGLL